MKECKKTREEILISGEVSGNVAHWTQCPECHSFAALEKEVRKIPYPVLEVPPELDQKIMDCARQQQSVFRKKEQTLRFVRKYGLGIAAAVAVCVTVPLIRKEQNTVRPPVSTAAFSYQTDEYSALNMELLLLSSAIEESAECMTQTAALSPVVDPYKY